MMDLERPMYGMLEKMRGRMSLHMPGAKGSGPFGAMDMYALDTTELPCTDDLYAPFGPILRAQELAARAAGAAQTIFLTGGSTAGVLAMLLTAARPGDTVILPRNAHLSAIHGCVLGDLRPVFARPAVTPDGYAYVTEENFLAAIREHPEARAVLVTRPDFYGGAIPLERIAGACRQNGMALLVDEAHGAHLNWMEGAQNAVRQGADMAVQSVHKTLPCLTAGAWLHFRSPNERALEVLRMVQTSSPAFYLMASMDDARAWMDVCGRERLNQLRAGLAGLRRELSAMGYLDAHAQWEKEPIWLDPTRLVIAAPQGGRALAKALGGRGIDVEMYDQRRIVCIFSAMDGSGEVQRLREALAAIPIEGRLSFGERFPLPAGERILSPREAFFRDKEPVALDRALNRTAGAAAGLYPPGIPLVMPGERIGGDVLALLKGADPDRRFGVTQGRIPCIVERTGADEGFTL